MDVVIAGIRHWHGKASCSVKTTQSIMHFRDKATPNSNPHSMKGASSYTTISNWTVHSKHAKGLDNSINTSQKW